LRTQVIERTWSQRWWKDSPYSSESTSKPNKLANMIAQCNPIVYDGTSDPAKLKQWIRGMEKVFVITKVPEEKVNIGTLYLIGEADN